MKRLWAKLWRLYVGFICMANKIYLVTTTPFGVPAPLEGVIEPPRARHPRQIFVSSCLQGTWSLSVRRVIRGVCDSVRVSLYVSVCPCSKSNKNRAINIELGTRTVYRRTLACIDPEVKGQDHETSFTRSILVTSSRGCP